MNRDDSRQVNAFHAGLLAGAVLWLAAASPVGAAGSVDAPLKPEHWKTPVYDTISDIGMPEIRIDPEAIADGSVVHSKGFWPSPPRAGATTPSDQANTDSTRIPSASGAS